MGKDFDARLAELGAKRLVPLGAGNEKDDEKWETAWTEWAPDLYAQGARVRDVERGGLSL